MAAVVRFLAGLVALVVVCAEPARADWLWFDDSQPGTLRIEANGFTLAPLVIAAGGTDHVLTDDTYNDRDLLLPGARQVRFAGTFSLHNSAAATFSMAEFFLPSAGGTVPGAELVIDGVPEGGGERVSGGFIGIGDPALPYAVPAGARAIVVDPDGTFPFSTQNLSMLVSLANDPAPVSEPAGLGVLGLGLFGLWVARRPNGRIAKFLI
ncbi:MAG: hypothetical protein ABI224_15690 [Acetobacteraceae bacterium]